MDSHFSLKTVVVLAITCFILTAEILLFSPYYGGNKRDAQNEVVTDNGESGKEEQKEQNQDESDSKEAQEEQEGIRNDDQSNTKLYKVTYVIDGDTIKIDYYGVETSVRLIGVNTPETVDPRKTVECFGVEASNYLKALLNGQYVKIERDYTQSDRDIYDRLLRYVYLNDEDVGYKIISGGYGYEYTYYVPHRKAVLYKTAEKEAASSNRGLWSPSACN